MGKFYQSILAGVLPFAGDMLGAFGSNYTNRRFAREMQQRQYEYNSKLQNAQMNFQHWMWQKANAYNTPAAELARLRSAGVNPALAFSNAGASAAPVPNAGSAGGVSAPTPEMINPGSGVASAVASAQNQQRLDNETKIADSIKDKNEAEAEAARGASRLSSVRANYEHFNLEMDKQLRSVIVANRTLGYQLNQLNYAIGYQDYVRGEVYTANFPQMLSQRMETNRINIRLLEKSCNRIDAEVNLLHSQARLTDEQAKVVRQKLVMSTFDAMMARLNQGMAERIYNVRYDASTGSLTRTSPSAALKQLEDSMRNNVAEQLQRSETGLLEAGLDQNFQLEYGKDLRFYNYETVRRGANLTRANIYGGIISSLVSVGANAISAGNVSSMVKMRKALMQKWNKVGREFNPYPSHRVGTEFDPDYEF